MSCNGIAAGALVLTGAAELTPQVRWLLYTSYNPADYTSKYYTFETGLPPKSGKLTISAAQFIQRLQTAETAVPV